MNKPPSAFVLANYVQACCWFVDQLPQVGETRSAHRLHIEAGGKGLNVALGLQRLGVPVQALIGCGQDAAGDALLQLLQQEGLSSSAVYRFAQPSGCGAGLIDDAGQNLIAVALGANLCLTAQHVMPHVADIQQARVVYGQFETALPALEHAFVLAAQAGVMTVLNPSPWQTPSVRLRQHTHTLIVNQTEAAQLLPVLLSQFADLQQTAPTHADIFAQIQPDLNQLWADWPQLQCCIITLGAQGALAVQREQAGFDAQAACAIVVKDTIGAGDAFAAGYLAALLRGQNVAEALAFANLCGGYMAAHSGVLAVLPTRAQLQNWLTNRP